MLRSQFEEKRAERVQKYQGMNLYIKNLHDDVTDDVLREEFAPFGSITSAKVGGDAEYTLVAFLTCRAMNSWQNLVYSWKGGSSRSQLHYSTLGVTV